MKTPEELKALKEEVETVKTKLASLTEEELSKVSGGETLEPGYSRLTCTTPYCGYSLVLDSEIPKGSTFKCPMCEHYTLTVE